MKCSYCYCEINELKERYKLYGIDGDFIHEKCLTKQKENMTKINTMTNKEFECYIAGELRNEI